MRTKHARKRAFVWDYPNILLATDIREFHRLSANKLCGWDQVPVETGSGRHETSETEFRTDLSEVQYAPRCNTMQRIA